MFCTLRLIVVVVLTMEVVLQVVCVVDAKGRSRGRRRRCPKACVQKFDNYQKGAPGPPGPPGPTGIQGPKGDRLVLPVCKAGEYLTSDGVGLKCQAFDVSNICPVLQKQCQSAIKDDPRTKDVTRHKGKGSMIQFTRNNIIQEIRMDSWDAEAFYIGGTLFVGLSQLGVNAFRIYRWKETREKSAFVKYQNFKLPHTRNWSPFKIGDVQYLVLALISRHHKCLIYYWDSSALKFEKFWQELSCTQAYDVAPFIVQDIQHIAVSNFDPSGFIGIFRWNGTGFETLQKIPGTAMYVEPYKIGKDSYLALSGTLELYPYVSIFKWNGKRFVLKEKIYTHYRPYEVTAFSTGRQHILAVATIAAEAMTKSSIALFKWNGKRFDSFQNITSVGARRVSAISSPLMGKDNTYLAVINSKASPVIYVMDGDNDNSFKLLHTIGQQVKGRKSRDNRGARDISFFQMGNNVYLLMTTHSRMYIYKGVPVSTKGT